ncbi:NAD(P)H-binding protein [Streptomyces silvisoli]|uniref:NAD(P)H-binding protein n=1 Tax=Streptomyces silvisoli TaxID=3034235 RepID=A0ABT5ZVR1_9ACTN|nr:NAD(P)H-binding protein [Streptomyces silvisoli]MDF3293909.1 NAD(P)H-binding protein [Streptomyces silvisoli]
MTILVTGARGHVSAAVLRELLERGEPVRAAGRKPQEARLPEGVPAVRLDLSDPTTFEAALDGVRKVFLYAEPAGIGAFLDAARAAGVEHIVLLSSQSAGEKRAEPNAIAAFHIAAEQALIASGIDWTIVRPGAFATNALQWAPSIRADGVVLSAFPNTHNSPVHERDIAAVAVQALLNEAHHKATYHLTGPESLSEEQMVELIAHAIGKPVRIKPISREEELARTARSTGPEIADVLIAYRAAGDGVPAEVHDGVREVTGRPAVPFSQWAKDHAADFQ